MVFEHVASCDPAVAEWLRVQTTPRRPWRAALELLQGGRLWLVVWRGGAQPSFRLSAVVTAEGPAVLAAFAETESCLLSPDSDERRPWELLRLEELWGWTGPTEG